VLSLAPGLPGDYLRTGFYYLTLRQFSLASRISFGSFFAHRDAIVHEGVYIGCHCILGKVEIGSRTHIASGVQILSGARQHARTADGRMSLEAPVAFSRIRIGDDCWIGAAAIVMADVGNRATIGAGAVVTRNIPDDVTAVGSPARPRSKDAAAQ
jgi:acetyltransferase-like isoleucine patch superfamily enzyme